LPVGVYSSKHIQNLYKNRNNKIDDYMHKASRFVTDYLVSNQIDTLVIGYSSGWKQGVNMGKKNNQTFSYIPYTRLIDLLQYKCDMVGIKIEVREESYTSKCSFLDNEEVCKHEKYLGKRVKRGMFKSSDETIINADLNGSLNILKKYLISKEAWNSNIYEDLVRASSTPNVLKIKTFN
jgi:transposase, IS605 orfB family